MSNNNTYYPVPKSHSDIQFTGISFYVKSDVILNKQQEQVSTGLVYVHERDYESYLNQLMGRTASSQAGVNPVDALNSATEALLFYFAHNGVSPYNLNLMGQIAQKVVTMEVRDIRELFVMLKTGRQIAPGMFRAVIARYMASQEGWTSEATLKRLVTAALFCDIGLIVDSSQHHFLLSSEILQNYKLSSDIIQAVRQHHEYLDGTGPLGAKKFTIHPFARIIRIADELYPYFNKGQLAAGLQHIENLSPQKLDSAFVSIVTSKFMKKS